jgi:rusticyanin
MTDFNSPATDNRELPMPPPPRRGGTPRPRARTALVTAVIAVIAAGGGYAIARGTASSPAPAASPPPAAASPAPAGASPAAPATGGGNPGMSMGGAGGSADPGFSSASLAQSIGRQVGMAMADMAPQTVSLAQTRVLGDQVPAGASVDKASNTITFTGGSVSFTVVAVPPGGPDMTFRVAGLTDPTLVVRAGAQATVQFINGDTDEAHAWMITSEQPPFSFYQPKTPAISGAFSGLIGDPTASGQGASTFTFQAAPAGTYQYICPMPGHAQMGMHGAFIVR